MSSTELAVTASGPPPRTARHLPTAALLGLLASVADGVGELRSVAVNGVKRTVDIDTMLLGDVGTLVGGLGHPVDGIAVEESHDIGIVRAVYRGHFQGWDVLVQHVIRTPTIETQEGQRSA